MKSKNRKVGAKEKMTQAELANALGISRQLVAYHLKTGNAPPIHIDGKLNVAEWVVHLAATGRSGSVPKEYRERIAEQKLRILKATAAKVELEQAEKEKTVLNKATGFRFLGKMMGFFWNELDRYKFEMPGTLFGRNAADIHTEIDLQIKKTKDSLRAMLSKFENENSSSDEVKKDAGNL